MFEKKAIAIFINIGRRIWSYWLTFISFLNGFQIGTRLGTPLGG